MILDSGIHVGAGSDSAQISTLDPWLIIYYMVTGKNAAGRLSIQASNYAHGSVEVIHGREWVVLS